MALIGSENRINLLVKIPQGDGEIKKERLFEDFVVNVRKVAVGRTISLEIAAINNNTYFIVNCDAEIKGLIEGQIYASFPDCEIILVNDYALLPQGKTIAGTELELTRASIYPFKRYDEFEKDSLSSVFSVISRCEKDEQVWVQTILIPLDDSWWFHLKRGLRSKLAHIRNIFRIKDYFKSEAVRDIRKKEKDAVTSKLKQENYKVTIRMAYVDDDKVSARNKLMSLAHAYSQFNDKELNEFKRNYSIEYGNSFINKFTSRKMGKILIMGSTEVASIYHYPNPDFIPHTVHILSKKAPPPQNLPTKGEDVSFFGSTNYHNQNIPFGIKQIDRRRHLYIVGKSGVGKSKMIELLVKEDIMKGRGVGVLDPHGDLVENIIRFIPEHRIQDVVYFDPSDVDFPVAFNPLEKVPQELKMILTIGFIDIFKKLFGANWSDRLEHVLRYTVLALLDSADTTVFSILKMLTDKNYRQRIVARIDDNVVKNFWVNEFASWSEKFDAEAIMPLLNKVGQFVSTKLIRNIVGQPENKINIRDIMDNKKILLMKVSKGLLGEENSNVIGAMIITKLYQAAMSRQDLPEEQRVDFYMYIDEFQNFATDTFREILSEARKYRLNLTMAHQYMGQLNEEIKKTVFGNVGSIISFRVGGEDAGVLENEYEPVFKVRDMINLAVRDFYIKLSVDGETGDPFSGRTVDMTYLPENYRDQIINQSREKYARPLKEVEEMIEKWDEMEEQAPVKKENDPFQEDEFEAPLV